MSSTVRAGRYVATFVAIASCLFSACATGSPASRHAAPTSSLPASSGSPATSRVAATATPAAATSPAHRSASIRSPAAKATLLPASQGVAGAKPGTYTYDVMTTSSGPPPRGGRVSEKAALRVDPVRGSDQHTAVVDKQGNGEQYDFRYSDNATEVLDLKFTGPFEKEFKPERPATYMPTGSTSGAMWSWDMTSTDRSSSLHADFKLTSEDTITIGAEPIQAAVADGTITINTKYNGAPLTVTIRTTKWWSRDYKLVVKRHDITDIAALNSHTDTTQVLESAHPR